jgi:hypothetical protein
MKYGLPHVNHTVAATEQKRFITTKKSYMGLGPAKVEMGDFYCFYAKLRVTTFS